jgi:branched-subunit amino acid ABC-type transport system permease component
MVAALIAAGAIGFLLQHKKTPTTDTGSGGNRNSNGQPEGPMKARRPSRMPSPIASVAFAWSNVAIIVVSVAVIVALFVFFSHSKVGEAVLAALGWLWQHTARATPGHPAVDRLQAGSVRGS